MEPLDYMPLSKEQRLARHINVTIVDRKTGAECTRTLGEFYYPNPIPQEQAENWLNRLSSDERHELELMESVRFIF